jgi:hypothetical protein
MFEQNIPETKIKTLHEKFKNTKSDGTNFACTRSASTDNNWPRVPRFGDYFQLAIASMSFPFCCCLFSLYVKERSERNDYDERRHNTQLQRAREKLSVGK